jgi:(E)-4-hydroxy-3-methylbut-2-enyl-diphosphate synthase
MNTLSKQVGKVQLGGNHRVALQTMTTTNTVDVEATVAQVSPERVAASSHVDVRGKGGGQKQTRAREHQHAFPTTQVKKCADAGADMVRITVQGKREAKACMEIRQQLFKDG